MTSLSLAAMWRPRAAALLRSTMQEKASTGSPLTSMSIFTMSPMR